MKQCQGGFTAFELIGILVTLTFLILAANKIMDNMNKTREYNQLADQARNFSQKMSKYIEDNYRNLVNQVAADNDVILAYPAITGYMPDSLSAFTRRGQLPCIYITDDSNTRQISSLRAYLIFGDTVSSHTQFSKLDITNIAYTIGGDAGVLVKNNSSYKFEGSIENSLSFSTAVMSKITQNCGFVNPLPSNSLIIDLSKRKSLFASLKGYIDRSSTGADNNPTLKKSKNTALSTMQTNLYLDNIYQESYSYTKYDCPSVAQISDDANSFCINSQPGFQMYPGSAAWTGVIQNGEKICLITATAHFYQTVSSPSCDGVNMGDPNSYCPAINGTKIIVPGSGTWSPLPGQLSADQCLSNAYARYKTRGICDGNAWWINQNNPVSRGDGDSLPNWQRAVTNGAMGQGIARSIACLIKQGDDHDSMVHCPGTYNQTTGMCDIGLRCFNRFFCANFVVNTSFAPTDGGEIDATSTYCGQGTAPANFMGSTEDLGYLSCGSKTINALTTTVGVPPKHVYKAIDYGLSTISGQRIQIKSNAPTGNAVTTSQLNVNNAGLQAAFIAPNSHPINVGTSCNSNDIGKIAQDLSGRDNGIISSQLQCMYNPTFCSEDGYCYLPVKNSSFVYKYLTLQQSGQCPAGTIVDNNQPSDGIPTSVTCPVQAGWNLLRGPYGKETNCYKNLFGMSFCQGYQSLCTYTQGDIPVSALNKLRCTNSTSTFTVDNYRP